jgi:transcriptional regulator EpsA
VRPWLAQSNVMIVHPNNNNREDEALRSAQDDFQLTAEETEKLLRIFAESLRVRRHYQLFTWLQGELQHFLPHRILISAWGDFPNWNLKLDIVSGLPGVRTEQLAHCRIDALLQRLFASWVEGGRRPAVVRAEEMLEPIGACTCPMHTALRGLHSILVHGVRDERGGYDSLYVAMHSRPFTDGRPRDQWSHIVDLLISQIDIAFRRVAAFRFAADSSPAPGAEWLDLSSREQEILDWISQGKANADIGAGLGISPFTVKNHLRRIYKKMGVRSRFEAAAKYNQAISESRKYLRR